MAKSERLCRYEPTSSHKAPMMCIQRASGIPLSLKYGLLIDDKFPIEIYQKNCFGPSMRCFRLCVVIWNSKRCFRRFKIRALKDLINIIF
jgi:hypothetical protein